MQLELNIARASVKKMKFDIVNNWSRVIWVKVKQLFHEPFICLACVWQRKFTIIHVQVHLTSSIYYISILIIRLTVKINFFSTRSSGRGQTIPRKAFHQKFDKKSKSSGSKAYFDEFYANAF